MSKESPLDETIRLWASGHSLPKSHLDRWLQLAPADGRALWQVAEELRFRTGQMVSALELLEEISVREKEPISAILARDQVRRVIRGPGSAPGRAHALIEMLRALRYPEIGRYLDRLNSETAALGLPRPITILLPKDLSSDELRIQVLVRSAGELRSALRTLAQNEDALARILGILQGIEE